MNKKLITGLCLSTFLFTGCSVFTGSPNEDDVYASVTNEDVLNDNNVRFGKRVSHMVTFAFDSTELPKNTADVVEPHVRYLISNPTHKVALQGNASNEGSRTYNYELAKSRVQSVKKIFLDLGIEESQIVELSVGEMQDEFSPQRSVLIVY
jgi:peptidoglycan-associated lipoprotein